MDQPNPQKSDRHIGGYIPREETRAAAELFVYLGIIANEGFLLGEALHRSVTLSEAVEFIRDPHSSIWRGYFLAKCDIDHSPSHERFRNYPETPSGKERNLWLDRDEHIRNARKHPMLLEDIAGIYFFNKEPFIKPEGEEDVLQGELSRWEAARQGINQFDASVTPGTVHDYCRIYGLQRLEKRMMNHLSERNLLTVFGSPVEECMPKNYDPETGIFAGVPVS
ncbi:MAG TPA: hypothetical protein VJI75_04050 [Candidatus Nanoarchaeia archaeon]|nr:hypothetical protein [Candidatus Nanoarchaeia archaeon]